MALHAHKSAAQSFKGGQTSPYDVNSWINTQHQELPKAKFKHQWIACHCSAVLTIGLLIIGHRGMHSVQTELKTSE